MSTIWFDKPSANWNEALPVGNGRLGGMIFGGVLNEEIHLNDDSVWYGGPRDPITLKQRKHSNAFGSYYPKV